MEPSPEITVTIIEDDARFRQVIVEMLSLQKDIRVTGSYDSADGFLKSFHANDATGHHAAIYWVDINLPDGNGIDIIRAIKAKLPESLCMICSLHDDDETIFEALSAGANGYILKGMSVDKMIQSVYELKEGGAPMSPFIANKVIRSFNKHQKSAGSLEVLSERENEVLHHLAKGLLYKEIGSVMGISIDTIKKHLSKIYSKLHVQNRTEAVLRYMKK